MGGRKVIVHFKEVILATLWMVEKLFIIIIIMIIEVKINHFKCMLIGF